MVTQTPRDLFGGEDDAGSAAQANCGVGGGRVIDRRRLDPNRDKVCKEFYIHLCKYAAQRTGYTFERLTGRDRTAQICRIRSCVYFVLKEEEFNSRQIAQAAGKDHTTILYALKAFQRDANEYTGMWSIVTGLRDVAADLNPEILCNV
ncbi:hypothetical protein CCB80_03170 [Armatimonadetes bacterium Uphvl-Ar1]|nr:hypothetical protein CCB80_03170 [Armatimonadetes bacterium Uphvl-Ar1]